MSSPTPPSDSREDGPGNPGSAGQPAAPTRRRGAARVRPAADFELMLALRGAARARDLRNRVVRPRSAETRDVTSAGHEGPGEGDQPRDLAHPN